jgi:two-component system, NarL family, sensor kinase
MLAANLGHTNRAVPPFPKGNRDTSEMTAWADMLSRIGHKNSQLYDMVGRDSRPLARHSTSSRTTGSTILQELERERSRIARELHAGAGQPLAGIKLNLEMLDECFAELPPHGREALARLQTLADQAFEQVRAVSHSLHPPAWQYLTTSEALRNLLDSSGLASRLALQLEVPPMPFELPHSLKITVYRCTQECIANITRHSGATSLAISLREQEPGIELRIQDNGNGFDISASSTGIGLRALHDHAAALGGTCDITTGASGTTVVIKLPLVED